MSVNARDVRAIGKKLFLVALLVAVVALAIRWIALGMFIDSVYAPAEFEFFTIRTMLLFVMKLTSGAVIMCVLIMGYLFSSVLPKMIHRSASEIARTVATQLIIIGAVLFVASLFAFNSGLKVLLEMSQQTMGDPSVMWPLADLVMGMFDGWVPAVCLLAGFVVLPALARALADEPELTTDA